MDPAIAILVTLIVYKLLLLGIGVVAQRRTKDGADFFLAGHGLSPLVAAISASASSSSGWTLLGVSGWAFKNGLSALWLFPGCVGGFALNWYLVAPRLRRYAATRPEALTVTTLLAGPSNQPGNRTIRATAALIVLFSLMAYVASQFQASGKTFSSAFDLDATTAILLGSAIVVVYTMIGGFWAVSLTDTLQGLVMAATAILLPVAALIQIGGWDPLWAGLQAVNTPGYLSLTGGAGGAAGIGMVLGFLGIGLGYPGQPHVVNRFMALRDDTGVRQARRYAMLWAVIVYAGMIQLGLCARILLGEDLGDHEQAFVAVAEQLFPPVVAGVMIAAVLSAIMSTADSQLLVAASAVAHDLDLGGQTAAQTLARSRLVIAGLSVLAVLTALYVSATIFSTVLFAWSAMGSAFGPLLLVTLWRGPVSGRGTLLAMLAGFGLSVIAYCFAPTKGAIERIVPFVVAFGLAWMHSRRRN